MPATQGLPPEAQAALDEYVAALDAALPGIARGIYLTGSAVLGDWQPGRSDLDILTVTGRALGERELSALEMLHAGIPDRPYRDAAYLPASAIGARAEAEVLYPGAVDGMFSAERCRPDPVLWATLDRAGLTVRGPAAGTLGAGPGEQWLRAWNQGNLVTYWRPWAMSVRSALRGRADDAPVPAFIVPWAALGPGRLHATITTGAIISKTASAGYTARLLPRYGDLLARARAHRLGEPVSFTVADAYQACDLVYAVAADAARLGGSAADEAGGSGVH